MPDTAAEFPRPIDLSRIGSVETAYDIGADADERAALARRFDLLGLGRLEAHVTLRRVQGGGGTVLRLKGHISADVTQACVVTLEPVAGRIEQDFAVLYGDQDEAAADAREITIDADAEESVEPWPQGGSEGTLDIGEAVAQELGLALDPYPHAPGAALASEAPQEPPGASNTPFAVLEKLRKSPGKGKA